TDRRPAEYRKEPVVELCQLGVGRLIRRATEMRRNVSLAPAELTLVEEPQSGREEGYDGRGLVNSGSKCGRRAWLVVVLEEASHPFLVVRPRIEVFAHRPGVTLAESVVEPLVVGVIKALLLQRPFQVPVNFGHEAKVGYSVADAPGRPRPEERR